MCTTMIITNGATVDGAMMVTHSDDNELSDQRIIYVPAQHHAPGSLRGVVDGSTGPYPRLVSKARGPGYEMPGRPDTPLIGQIPQVAHTFAYFDGSYGIMNEHNLMMGECTNGARFHPKQPVSQEEAQKNGAHCRLFYSAELSRVALERCATARDAVTVMGELIDKYGYFGTGETLLVGDEKEGWVFEMCALPDEDYHSAWIAQRVPDGTVFVAANEFRIREIRHGDPDQVYSSRLRPDAPVLTQGMLWYGPDVAYTSCFVPFPSEVGQLPHAYQIGDPQQYSRNAAWWAFDFVANWARLNYQRMCQVEIFPMQRDLEARQGREVEAWDRQFREGGNVQELTRLCEQNAAMVVMSWWELADRLIARYSDGYINMPTMAGKAAAVVPVGYSSQWLRMTDYRNGPVSYDMKL